MRTRHAEEPVGDTTTSGVGVSRSAALRPHDVPHEAGVATRQPDAGLLWLPALGADPVTIDVSPANGFNGAFLWPTDGYVVASEGGEPVLYRWLGLPDD